MPTEPSDRDRSASEIPIASLSKNRTFIGRIAGATVRVPWRTWVALARWVRGLLVAGVAAGVLAAIRWLL